MVQYVTVSKARRVKSSEGVMACLGPNLHRMSRVNHEVLRQGATLTHRSHLTIICERISFMSSNMPRMLAGPKAGMRMRSAM